MMEMDSENDTQNWAKLEIWNFSEMRIFADFHVGDILTLIKLSSLTLSSKRNIFN